MYLESTQFEHRKVIGSGACAIFVGPYDNLGVLSMPDK